MGQGEAKVRESMRKFFKNEDPIFPVTVKSVNEDTHTVDCVHASGLELFDVKLKALMSDDKGIIVYPKQNTQVQIARTGEDDYLVVAVDDPEKICWIIGGTKYEVDAQGFLIQRQNESLKKILEDLFDAIFAMSFVTPSGNTTTLNNLAQFQAIKNRIPNLLK